MENIKKHMYRVQQLAQQTVGRAEKTEVRSEDLQQVEQRVEAMVEVLHHLKSKLSDCFRSRIKEENVEKRKKKMDEYNLANALLNDARQLRTPGSVDLLSPVMHTYSSTLLNVVDAMVRMEMDIEKHVFESLFPFFEAEKNILHSKEKLKRLVLDMDAAKTRRAAGQARGEKSEHTQEEVDNASIRVETCKDTYASEVFTLASKEVEMANVFSNLIKVQMEFYKSSYRSLEDCLATVSETIDKYPRRPVYGSSLLEHLKYTHRDIALVIAVCCEALNEIGLDAEGLFRIPGNALKVRRLKSAFDAGQLDLSEYEFDPHSIAGALKQYLRELPEPLLCGSFNDLWTEAVRIESNPDRLKKIKGILQQLPQENFNNIRYLVKFLAKVAQNHGVTKMTTQNLAIVFGPSLLWTAEGNSETFDASLAPNSVATVLVDCLISNANVFFPDDIQFTSPLICSLLRRYPCGLENDSVNSIESFDTNSTNEEKSATEMSRQRSSSSVASYAKPVVVKKVKPPAPPPPIKPELLDNELADEKAAEYDVIVDASSHCDGRSSISDDHIENSSWVALEVDKSDDHKSQIISVPVPRTRLSIKRDHDVPKEFRMSVDDSVTEKGTNAEPEKALFPERCYIKDKAENGVSGVSSSSRSSALRSGKAEDSSSAEVGTLRAIPNRPPLPKKTILSKCSFKFKRNTGNSFFKLNTKDRFQMAAGSSVNRGCDGRMGSRVIDGNFWKKENIDYQEYPSIRLAQEEPIRLEMEQCNRSKPCLPDKPKIPGILHRSYTKL